ncbi:hypothetical protein DES36_11657 [Alkalibaculum bacchi]|jgi:hypothetical protein|uniref:Uncharacterized protein n=1 Tax=Alkalibaculum bacchi TaxID=645887 RepID=A0A366I0D3_9FIRM|nr:hypothetical protein [Alkalibaculum bacchi]RBP60400.1 hypothetical protein DES36_11657 [Alkalibaculum bacchi]
MNKPFDWKNTSLKIDSRTSDGSVLIKALNKESIELRLDESIHVLENQFKHYILEDDFINNSRNLPLIIRKYSKKDYEDTIRIYDEELSGFKSLKVESSDKKIYEEIIKENIIDADIREFPISINTLEKVLDKDSRKSSLILDIFILISIANKSKFNAEDYSFEVGVDDKTYRATLNIDSESLNLFPIYDWIINNEEYKESYNVKLHVVRQVIINKQNMLDVKGLLEDSKLAYRRIISKKTNEYFEQLNQLKDDFLILSQNENSTLRTLNLTFFAWLGSLGLELFNIIKDYTGTDILQYVFFSTGAKKGIVVLVFIIALIALFVSYTIEMKSLEETYEVIKRIYKDKILFETENDDENKFEKIIKKPKIGILHIVIFSLIFGILLLRFLKTFPW